MNGDSNAITRDYFDSLLLESRYIDSDLPDTSFELFGEKFETPIMTAALSHLHNICDNAMVEIAKGARDAGAVHWTGISDVNQIVYGRSAHIHFYFSFFQWNKFFFRF